MFEGSIYRLVDTVLEPFVREVSRELRFETIRFQPLNGWILVEIKSTRKCLLFRGIFIFANLAECMENEKMSVPLHRLPTISAG